MPDSDINLGKLTAHISVILKLLHGKMFSLVSSLCDFNHVHCFSLSRGSGYRETTTTTKVIRPEICKNHNIVFKNRRVQLHGKIIFEQVSLIKKKLLYTQNLTTLEMTFKNEKFIA